MQLPPDSSLTLRLLLALLQGQHGEAEIVAVDDRSGARRRTAGRELAARASSLARGLGALGVGRGDRVATLAWNTQAHLECFWAVPCLGAVLHTLNPRLAAHTLAAVLERSGARVVVVDEELLPLAEDVRRRGAVVEELVVVSASGSAAGGVDYEALVGSHRPLEEWPELSEHEGAGLCFTSGTAGEPKGVLYTHRALVLHALTMAAFDPYATPHRDRCLAVVPLFHAMGWNLPYITALTGSDLVLPGRTLKPDALIDLIRDEAVTFSCGVPTVWTGVIDRLDARGADLPSLRAIACGGSRVPEELMRRYQERGITVLQGWGMTETGPGAARVFDAPSLPAADRWRRRTTAGRIRPLYEVRLRGDDGTLLPHDGRTAGEIEIRGPLVAREYFGDASAGDERFREGWLRTGDIGTVDAAGWLDIVDREKDLIKSGGEWVSSLDIEAALLEHPAVAAAAVIPIPDAHWMERPLACVVAGRPVRAPELWRFLAERLPRWCVPTHFAWVDAVPLTALGKPDKRALRARFDADDLDVAVAERGEQEGAHGRARA